MNNDAAKELLRVLRALTASSLGEFLDIERFVYSPKFSGIASYAIEHFAKHGDHAFIGNILSLYVNSKYYKPLLLWFCQNAALDYTFGNGTLILSKSNRNATNHSSLREHINASKGTASDMIIESQKTQDQPLRHIDALDSPLRLPGSFGSGRSR